MQQSKRHSVGIENFGRQFILSNELGKFSNMHLCLHLFQFVNLFSFVLIFCHPSWFAFIRHTCNQTLTSLASFKMCPADCLVTLCRIIPNCRTKCKRNDLETEIKTISGIVRGWWGLKLANPWSTNELRLQWRVAGLSWWRLTISELLLFTFQTNYLTTLN